MYMFNTYREKSEDPHEKTINTESLTSNFWRNGMKLLGMDCRSQKRKKKKRMRGNSNL